MSCSPLETNRRFGGAICLHINGRRMSQIGKQREAGSKFLFSRSLFFHLEGGAICTPETSIEIHWTTRRCSPQYRTVHNNRCENHRFFKNSVCMDRDFKPASGLKPTTFRVVSCAPISYATACPPTPT
jgi:hypothetical protein